MAGAAPSVDYDEFGNLIRGGDDEEEQEPVERVQEEHDEAGQGTGAAADGSAGARGDAAEGGLRDEDAMQREEEAPAAAASSKALVVRREMFKSAEDTYPGVQVQVGDEDTQPLEQPIIAPVKAEQFDRVMAESDKGVVIPATTFSKDFLFGLLHEPATVRNLAVVGALHHGKTSLMDLFLAQTHRTPLQPRYTDTRNDEQARLVSIKSTPVSLVMPTLRGKSFLFNMMDTPGHANLSDEATAALRLSDGAVVVVDVAEGVKMQTQRLITHALQQHVPLVVVLNKMDRLILELKLPPADAYHKIRQVLDDINAVASTVGGGTADGVDAVAEGQARGVAPFVQQRLSPELGNVCFASSAQQWCFSLESFAKMYARNVMAAQSPVGPSGVADGNAESPPEVTPPFDYHKFATKLWGDFIWDEENHRIIAKDRKDKATGEVIAPPPGAVRTFISFILDPLYKLEAQVLGESQEDLRRLCGRLNIPITQSELQQDIRPLLRTVMSRFFGDCSAFSEMCVRHVPSPLDNAPQKIESIYSGSMTSHVARAMKACDARGPLMVNIAKLYSTSDGNGFRAFGRVFSGTLVVGQNVRVLGEQYKPPVDTEDCAIAPVQRLFIAEARYRLEVSEVPAGGWVLLEGVERTIYKTATLCDEHDAEAEEETHTFRPLPFNTVPTMKVAVEPLNPKDLPKMVEGLRSINRSYPLVQTKVEESGEHVIFGTGELQLDCVMHDLRDMYSGVEIKVSDPYVALCETVTDRTLAKCFAETPNKRNKLTMTAEPLDKELAVDIETGAVSLSWDRKRLGEYIQTKYNWDLLAARSVWAFGPDSNGPNVLIDDTLPSEVNHDLLYDVRSSVVQGFQWGTRQGPLCDEPMREVKMKLLDALIDTDPAARYPTQIVPTARRVAYSAFLMATPRLMEPIYFCEIEAPADCVSAVYTVLAKRRGHVTQDAPRPGNPFYLVSAYVPVLESFGFETDLRSHTQGQAFVQSVFNHWALAPGDPLDKSVMLKPLMPVDLNGLARELMVKTRRRKGLSEDVAINKFFDEALLAQLATSEGGGGPAA